MKGTIMKPEKLPVERDNDVLPGSSDFEAADLSGLDLGEPAL
jgi:hypothetical protein